MLDIHTFIHASHISWIRRMIMSNSNWDNIISDIYPDMKLLYYGCTFPKEYIVKIDNMFWKDVLFSWNLYIKQIVKQYPNNPLNSESLWFNPKFKIGNKTIYYKDWYNCGIRIVDDLINSQNTFMNANELEANYGVKNMFLKLQGVIASIKKFQRNSRQIIVDKKMVLRPTVANSILSIIKYTKGCRHIYNVLKDKQQLPKCSIKWTGELENIQNKDWKLYFSLPFKITKDTKLQWFQTRLIHRILPTNKYLTLIQIKDCAQCTFCSNDIETLVHLFWSCPFSRNIWNELLTFLKIEDYFPEFRFSPTNVILGIPNTNKKYTALNLIILKTKYIIYKNRCQNTNININLFQEEIKALYKLEKYLAQIRDRSNKFDEVWTPFKKSCKLVDVYQHDLFFKE